jgi:uncharacterized protein (TIGR00369 family)
MTTSVQPPATGVTPLAEEQLQQGLLTTPLHRQLSLQIRRNDTGIVLSGVLGPDLARADGHEVAHGGAVATLLDTATVWAAVATTSRLWATVDIRVDYLRPTALGQFIVEANVLAAGSTVTRARAELRDASGNLTASAIATLAAQARPTTA